MSDVIIFLADGFEEIEALTVVDVLRRGGVDIATVSISSKLSVAGAHGIEVKVDRLFNEAEDGKAGMLILPGGSVGTQNLMKHKGVNKLCAEFVSSDKYVCAICAAPMVLGEAGLLSGRTAVCYPGCEGSLHGANIGTDKVVKDGKIVTSKGPGTALDFAFALLELLNGGAVKDKVMTGMLLK